MKGKIEIKRVLLWSIVVVGICGACIGAWGYRLLYTPNFFPPKTVYIYIDKEKQFDTLCHQLRDSAGCKDIKGFTRLAQWLNYPNAVKAGRYEVTPEMGNLSLLRNLRSGHQSAIRLTFNNIRLKEDLAQRLGSQLMIGPEELAPLLADSAYCDSLGFTPTTIASLFIPNTYEVYWTISADKLVQRMHREYTRFWTEARLAKAKEAGLTPIEVSILASIVEEETAAAAEYPIVAGLYINRLRKGIPLQADPTVKFALGNFALQRILYDHLEVESPYNTYRYAGLPPGPIRIPTIKGLDAVLNHTHHNYLYMCAKEDLSGRHNFAVTLAEHNRNANRYRAELNKRKIW